MMALTQQRNLLVRVANAYFRDFPIQHGKGYLNKLLGRFLKVRIPGGAQLRLLNPMDFMQLWLMSNCGYEPDCTALLLAALEPGMVFFDVGANLGYYTLLASSKIETVGQVHAFEPSPAQFKHLSLNVQLNRASNVTLNNCALDENSGERDLFLTTGWNQGLHSLGRGDQHSRSCRVQCLTLDGYVAGIGLTRLDVLKIDVEGAEMLVLHGAEQTLSTLSPALVLFEACEEHYQRLVTQRLK